MYSYTPSELHPAWWSSAGCAGHWGEAVLEGDDVPAQRMSPQPAATLVMYPSWMSEMCKRFASSSRSVADWFKRIKNSELASIKPGGVGTEEFLHILCQPCHKAVVLADPLPQLVKRIQRCIGNGTAGKTRRQ